MSLSQHTGISTALRLLQDVGCEAESVREDAFYSGLPQRRQRGEAYDVLVDEAIGALRKRQAPRCAHIDDDTQS